MTKRAIKHLLLYVLLISCAVVILPRSANAICCGAHTGCANTSKTESKKSIEHITEEFLIHREWMVKVFFQEKLLPAMMLMTEQLTAVAMQQVLAIGTMLDAKHQLETQRLLQELTAVAHKDYHPSEGMCTFGTTMRSVAASERNTEFTSHALADRILQRQRIAGDVSTVEKDYSDEQSRFAQFISTYCDPKDNSGGLDLLCGSGGPAERRNKDINFTQTVDAKPTLEIDFSEPAGDPRPDEVDVLALATNLYGNVPPPSITDTLLAENDVIKEDNAFDYLTLRSLIAKRSVAQNSFSAIVAQRALGEEEVRPYMAAMLKEMGMPEDDIDNMLSDKPSYYAQMELLTKKLYQNPNFFTDLYDKPANIKRKAVTMQAIELMQKRDMFRSLLRAEANLSVMLELAVAKEQERLTNQRNN